MSPTSVKDEGPVTPFDDLKQLEKEERDLEHYSRTGDWPRD